MEKWLIDGRQPPQIVLRQIEGHLHRVACPLYLGAISLYIGWSLDRTHQMLEVLQTQGIVVPLGPPDLERHGFPAEANVWRLVEKPTPAKARW
jgi:hypothetical protein